MPILSEMTVAELKVELANAELSLTQLDSGEREVSVRDGETWGEFARGGRQGLVSRIAELKDLIRSKETGQPKRGPISITGAAW